MVIWTFRVLLLIGLLLAGFGVYFIYEANSSKSWNQVAGTVAKTKIVRKTSRSGNSGTYRTEYNVNIKYQYQVDGVTYNKTRFSLGTGDTVKGGFSNREDAQKWLDESPYHSGRPVTVYVKPGDTQESVLSSGINIGTIVPLIMGIFFMAGAIAIKVYLPRLNARASLQEG